MIWLGHTAQLQSMPFYEAVGVVEVNMIFDQKDARIYMH
jgi:hypothetical protein